MNRKKKLILNTFTSLAFQIVTIISGFILPRLILSHYGSEVNGLVNSITQFLHLIAFLELGVGTVVQTSLYKPLANKDTEEISKIIRSASKFFSKIALVLIIYVIILILAYPFLVNKNFDFIYTALLIAAMSINAFSRYYFGVVDRLLLTADQKGYIQYFSQIIVLILSTTVCYILISLNYSIQIVKLVSSCVFLLRPLFLRFYINQHYSINRKIQFIGEPIKQKWNGIAQHVSAVILDQTDIVVLTTFSTLTNVSIYSVYHLVISGVKTLFLSLTNGFQSLIGEMLAKEERDQVRELFNWVEWILHTGTVFVFGCTGVLIVPFVEVYTKGVSDANYIVPLFAFLITLAYAGHSLRLPYNILILAAGHYKQTQHNYIIAALINIIISVLTVNIWGLVGVAIGTLCSMVYQTIWMAVYDSRHILNTSINSFVKHCVVDVLMALIATLITVNVPFKGYTYLEFAVLAIIDASIWCIVVISFNLIFYKHEMELLTKKLKSKLRR